MRTVMLLGAGWILLNGCAAMIHGTKQTLPVTSEPAGAAVYVDGVKQGETPLSVELDRRKANSVIRIEKGGFAERRIWFRRSVDGWIAGNIFWGGIPGLAVDFLTGSAYALSPSRVAVDLARPVSGAGPAVGEARNPEARQIGYNLVEEGKQYMFSMKNGEVKHGLVVQKEGNGLLVITRQGKERVSRDDIEMILLQPNPPGEE